MKLSDTLACLIDVKNQGNMKESNQLEIADEIEKILEDMGIQVQPRFDIPIAGRVGSIQPKAISEKS